MQIDDADTDDQLDILIVTVSEYYYIPKFLTDVLDADEYRIVGITTMPPSLGTQNIVAFAWDLFKRFGPVVFIQHVSFYLKYLGLDVFARLTGLGQAYSPQTLAKRHDVDHRHTTNVNKGAYREYVKDRSPDVLVSIAATQQFDTDLIKLPSRCAINIHSSLLPEYRGVSPSFWTLLNDEPTTGITVHYIDEALDTGDVIRQEQLEIRDDDTLHSLNERVAEHGSTVLRAALDDIRNGTVQRTPIDPDEGTYYSLPSRAEVNEFLQEGNTFY